jgi:hypothetical protein
MAINYPVSWPSWWRVTSARLMLERPTIRTAARGGERYVDQLGRPLWSLSISTGMVIGANRFAAAAFIDTLRDGMGTISLSSPVQRRPLAYPGTGWAGINRHGGSAFDGTATVTAVSGNAVTITTLPSTYQARAGDLISWPYGSTRTLHRIVQDATASAGQVTVDVEPEVPPGVSYPQTVKMEAANAIFRLVEPVEVAIGTTVPPLSLRLIQHLRL